MAFIDLNPDGQLVKGKWAGHYLYPQGHGTDSRPYRLEACVEINIYYELFPSKPNAKFVFTAENIAAFRKIGNCPLESLSGCEGLQTDITAELPQMVSVFELQTTDGNRHIACVTGHSLRVLCLLCLGKPQLSAENE